MEDNIIEDIRNFSDQKEKLNKKEINYNSIKYIKKNLFRIKTENEAIKDRVIIHIKNLFEHEEEDYYKPVREGNFGGNNYIEYESNGI